MAIDPSGLKSTLSAFAAGLLLVIGSCLSAALCSSAAAQGLGDVRPGEPFTYHRLAMYDRPALTQNSSYKVYREGLIELWMRALDRNDPELQRLVVDSISHAYRRGQPGAEETAGRLVALLKDSQTRLDVRRAAAQTLVVMEATQHDEDLAELANKYGASVAAIIEPALTKWKSTALRDLWLQRVKDATAGPSMLSLAIEGLAAIDEKEAAEPLTRIVSSPAQSTVLRMLAARNLARIQSNGMPELARTMLAQKAPHPELPAMLAIELLSVDKSAETIKVLNELVDHDRTAVQSRALGRLYEIDFKLVDQHAEELVSSPDSNVRKWIARAMLDTEDVGRVAALANLLDDVNPTLRRDVAAGLAELGKQEALRDEVVLHAMRILNQDQWRGCEQACVVLGKLDAEPAGSRMVELLKHPRGEVKVASAWGLTQLRVAEHLPDMLEHGQEVHQGFKADEIREATPGYVEQMAHLFIAFGDQVYRPAEPLMRAYIPKDHSLGVESRAAAAWAIGFLYEDNPDDDLANQLAKRIADVGFEGETEETRQMSAVSIGRMKGETALPTLRRFAEAGDYVSRACFWAIEKITGEEPPPLVDAAEPLDTYFMTPLIDE